MALSRVPPAPLGPPPVWHAPLFGGGSWSPPPPPRAPPQAEGSRPTPDDVTFILTAQDHTLGNSLRYVLMRRCVHARNDLPSLLFDCACGGLSPSPCRVWRGRSRRRDSAGTARDAADRCACVCPLTVPCGPTRRKDVAFCGYTIPHPSEKRISVRLHTTGARPPSHYARPVPGFAPICYP